MQEALKEESMKDLKNDWSYQGFDMFRLYLDENTRLHVWDPTLAVPGVSVIHNHPWHFESTILHGSIRNIIYEKTYEEGFHYLEQEILCGPGGGTVGEPVPVKLSIESDTLYVAGDRYEMRADQLHQSRPEVGTVSVVYRQPLQDPDHARVYFHAGSKWVSAEPRPATDSEKIHILKLLYPVLKTAGGMATGVTLLGSHRL